MSRVWNFTTMGIKLMYFNGKSKNFLEFCFNTILANAP